MIPLVIVRPEPGASATLEAARALGLDALAFPIFAVVPVPWSSVPRETIDAVLLGSANAVRHAGDQLARLRGLPAYCVGHATARAAADAGFAVAATGSGGLQRVVEALAPGHRRLLRLAGAAHVPLRLPPDTTMETRVVYAAQPLALDPALGRMLRARTVVMLHSGEAAAHFDDLCTTAGIDRSVVSLATIGPRVSALAGRGWARIETADRPSDAALLALAHGMCQDAGAPSP